MLNFQYFMPTRVVFGPETLNQLGDTPYLPRGKKAMIVIGESGVMVKQGYLGRVQSQLAKQEVQTIVFDKVRPNPESDMVDEAAAICRDNGVDFIVGLGGGSTIDSAKSIALMATNTGKYWDYMQSGSGGGLEPEKDALPIGRHPPLRPEPVLRPTRGPSSPNPAPMKRSDGAMIRHSLPCPSLTRP